MRAKSLGRHRQKFGTSNAMSIDKKAWPLDEKTHRTFERTDTESSYTDIHIAVRRCSIFVQTAGSR